MKLSPESAAVIIRRVRPDVAEQLADHVEEEIGHALSDAQYDALSIAVEEKLLEAVGTLEVGEAQ